MIGLLKLLELTSEPTLPCYMKRPRRIDDGEPEHRFETPKAYFRQQYFELLDLTCTVKASFSAGKWIADS